MPHRWFMYVDVADDVDSNLFAMSPVDIVHLENLSRCCSHNVLAVIRFYISIASRDAFLALALLVVVNDAIVSSSFQEFVNCIQGRSFPTLELSMSRLTVYWNGCNNLNLIRIVDNLMQSEFQVPVIHIF
ncbi:hypothetical protein E5676_scaffold21G002330 [Cucumis melo var. makuwa]|uniref:Uncharacterized protein n=1 Tax=Cucumis melo var. makuwa TaxID=1194695 RepID=A0A5D3CY59_CUCMM|nr:hypothetical protein E5676_scaffold21G002330 [Cucumis melo var. makuwa]